MDCMGHVSQGREGGRQRWREVSGGLHQQQTWENEASRDGHHPPGAGLGLHCWALWPLKTLMHLQSDLDEHPRGKQPREGEGVCGLQFQVSVCSCQEASQEQRRMNTTLL